MDNFFDNNNTLILMQFGFLILFVGILILYYFSQYTLLKSIQPQNCLLNPSNVFLQIIPIFGNIYAFMVVAKIADSIRLEADNREIFSGAENDLLGSSDLLQKPTLLIQETRPTYGIGLAKCILNICGFIPIIRGYASFAWLICFIIYWVKIVKTKNMIQTL